MPVSPPASPLADVELAVSASRPDRVAAGALRAFRDRVPAVEVLRAAARSAAVRYDPSSGLAPHGLATLAAVAALGSSLDPGDVPLATLQGLVLASSEKKLLAPQPPPARVAGEVSHLGRSVLLAARAGNAEEAESVFLGIVEDGWERRMAGEVLFRAAIEDLGDSGHKLLMSVQLWRLARALGFRDARTVLRPAIQYLLRGERNRRPYEATMAVLGREWVDLDSLASGGRPLDDAGRARLGTTLASSSDEVCVESVLALLRDGYAATSVAEGIGVEAAKRLLSAEGYHLELAHGLLYARAARFVLEFSRSGGRLPAVFQAALRIRSPAPHLPSVAVPEPSDENDSLVRIRADLAGRRPREVAARVRVHLSRRYAAKPLLAALAHAACLDSSLANQGHNLLLADACADEYAATRAPEFLMALAKSVAASPKDLAESEAWSRALAP
jgi:hypothetical protein